MPAKKSSKLHKQNGMRVINKRYDPECPIDSIHPHPRNPRKGDVAAIDESIDANGFYGAVVVQESTHNIIVGNHRWISAKNHGALTVPTFFVDVSDREALKILLADNRTSDVAGYSEQDLAQLLTELKNEEDLYGTAFKDTDVDALLELLANEALGGGDGDAPEDFDSYDENLETEHTCPKCGYSWSGGKTSGKSKAATSASEESGDF